MFKSRAVIRRFCWLLISLSLSSCATPYTGLGPNFYVKDPVDIQAEYDAFKLETSILGLGGYWMGDKFHTHDSVMSVVEEVSPEAASKMNSGQGNLVIGVVFASLAALYLLDPESAQLSEDISAVVLLSGVGVATYGYLTLRAGAHEYNRKLKTTLSLEARF